MNKPKVIPDDYDPRFMFHKSEISFTRDSIRRIKEEREEIKRLEKALLDLQNKNKLSAR